VLAVHLWSSPASNPCGSSLASYTSVGSFGPLGAAGYACATLTTPTRFALTVRFCGPGGGTPPTPCPAGNACTCPFEIESLVGPDSLGHPGGGNAGGAA